MITLWEVEFQNPILLAAGTAGFGREIHEVTDLTCLGGLVTKAVSPLPREGNQAPRVGEFPGGMINSVGLANPGMDVVAREMLPWLAKYAGRARVIVNVVGDLTIDYVRVVDHLAGSPVVTAFELNVSCPNTDRGGEEFGADVGVLTDLVARCVGETDKPVLVKLAPTLPDIAATAAAAAAAGARGISVINTIPGLVLEDRAPGRMATRLGGGRGGVSGPALLPVGLLATQRVKQATGLPVIGVGGIRSIQDVLKYIEVGASLVAIGTAALADPRVPERIVDEWSRRSMAG